MLPFPKLFNNYQNPPKPEFLFASDIVWRKDVQGSGYRPAVEGVEFEFSNEDHTKVSWLPDGMNTFYNVNLQKIPNKKIFARFKFNGTFDRCVIQPWQDGALFTYGITPNQWNELRVEYNVDGTINSRWFVNGSQQYYGSKNPIPSFFFGLFSGPNSVEFDVGQNGGNPPAGFEWWYNPRN